MKNKSMPSKSLEPNYWSLKEIYEHYSSNSHPDQEYLLQTTAFLNAMKERLDGPPQTDISEKVMSLISCRQNSEAVNHSPDKIGTEDNVHYRIRKIRNQPRSVRDHLRIARKRKPEPARQSKRRGRRKKGANVSEMSGHKDSLEQFNSQF